MAQREEMTALYDQDFYEWTQRTSELLRRGCFAEADIEHVAEEIEDLGKERKHTLKSQTRRLLVHLLKYQFQPRKRSRSWMVTITNARVELADLLEENPSLARLAPKIPAEVYDKAVKLAMIETGLERNSFPAQCPYTVDQILDDDFLPE